MEDTAEYTAEWPNLDDLGFERMGLPRNLLFATLAAGFIFYQILMATWGETLEGAAGFLPMIATVAIWKFYVIPAVRDMNDKLPRGYWQGIYDYYFTNPGHLQIVNDPEPMPLYIRGPAVNQPDSHAK